MANKFDLKARNLYYFIMERNEQNINDTWNLEAIFKDENEFKKAKKKALSLSDKIAKEKTRLADKDTLLSVLKTSDELGITLEKLGSYAYMKTSEDGANSENVKRMSEYMILETKISEETAYVTPEILALEKGTLLSFIKDKAFKDYKIMLKKLIREKEHILSEKEERILSLQGEVGASFSRIFDDMTDIDFNFGEIDGIPLTHASYSSFLQSENEDVRKRAYYAYYKKFDENKHSLSKTYEGAIKQSLFTSRARGYKSTLERALFTDNIKKEVFLNLIDAAHEGFPYLKRFYELKRKVLNLAELHHYDVYAPLVKNYKSDTPYEKAVDYVIASLSPLSKEYTSILQKGLTTDRWVDRYENKGKASGAYSNGGYKTLPYIMMSYKSDVLRDVFTIAHEGGHSMHSYYSAKNNPYSSYNYTIFEAEVASTFNEMMLFHYLLNHSNSKEETLFLLTKQADDIVATFFRQTMFSEFEYRVHTLATEGQALALDVFLSIYKELLSEYLPTVSIDETGSLEALRIPHFYRPFYVWKYATGISAAAALSKKVLDGGEKERDDYLSFLKSGGSHFPLDSLKKAGADLRDKATFLNVVELFKTLVETLEKELL